MQAVRATEQESLSPEKQAYWLKTVGDLGTKQQLLAVPKSVECEMHDPAVFTFLLSLWHEEERKRRRREEIFVPAAATLFVMWLVVILVLAVMYLLAIINNSERPVSPVQIVWLEYMLLFCSVGYFVWTRRRQRGIAFLLINTDKSTDCSLLLDMLAFGEFTQDTKRRLTECLPRYHDADTSPFDKHQTKTLLLELETGLRKRKQRLGIVFTKVDADFLVAVLEYFECEVATGWSLPEGLTRILLRYNKAADTSEANGLWDAPHRAAADCLARLREKSV